MFLSGESRRAILKPEPHPFGRVPLRDLITLRRGKSSILKSIRNPPCDYPVCQGGFYTSPAQQCPPFSYRRILTDVEAKDLVESYMKDINECMGYYLADRLKSHADLFMNRWKKRSQEGRRTVLMEAAPYLADSSFFIVRHRDEISKTLQLLVPWLNVDILKTNPEVLFALLHYRVAYQPQDWAAFDSSQLDFGWGLGSFDIDFCNKHMVMHGPQYGTLVDWEEDAAHRVDILGFPRARLVLEAQALILTTLRSIVDKILLDADRSLPHQTHKWLELTANASFKRTGEVESWSPYTNQAFSAPPLFDPENLLSLINTRLEASSDHLWHLQCEPAYMRRHIKIHSRMPNTKVTDESIAPLMNYNWWHMLKEMCVGVVALHRYWQTEIYPGNPLPSRYNYGLGHIEFQLYLRVIYWVETIIRTLPVCPGFSRHWRLTCNSDTDSNGRFASAEREYKFVQLDHAVLLGFIQDHLSQCSSKEKTRIDEGMLTAIRLKTKQWREQDAETIERLTAKHALLAEQIERITKGGPNRGALETFWGSMRELVQEKFAHCLTKDQMDNLLQVVSADKTQEHMDARNEAEPMLRHLNQDDLGQSAKGETQPTREKIKSRPESSGVQPTETTTLDKPIPAIGPESCLETNEAIAVDERSLKLFTHMFPETAHESTKTVGWNDFVHAICSVGFTARNNGGSAVLFESIDGGKIVFHKPHPVAKIDPIMLQSMGKRMTKWFGWNRRRFMLASDGVDRPCANGNQVPVPQS
ncbi:hypothetical protein F5B19DRAFT_486016 [Rostrohypoxylon terebratum]|nr:hypothetical protein F5B19DRAFT_486016 [Rostrohypoxylon terebratum]